LIAQPSKAFRTLGHEQPDAAAAAAPAVDLLPTREDQETAAAALQTPEGMAMAADAGDAGDMTRLLSLLGQDQPEQA
jgi:hypothetical protein